MTKLEIYQRLNNATFLDSEALATALASLDATIADVDGEEIRKGLFPLIEQLGGKVTENEGENGVRGCSYRVDFPNHTGENCSSLNASGEVPEGVRHIREVVTEYIEKHRKDIPITLAELHVRFVNGVLERFCADKDGAGCYPISLAEFGAVQLYVYFAGDRIVLLRSSAGTMDLLYTDAILTVPFTMNGINELANVLAQFAASVEACQALEAKAPALVHYAYKLTHEG